VKKAPFADGQEKQAGLFATSFSWSRQATSNLPSQPALAGFLVAAKPAKGRLIRSGLSCSPPAKAAGKQQSDEALESTKPFLLYAH
jgi:hypothetical protein